MIDFIIYFFLKYTYLFISLSFLVKIFLFIKHRNKKWKIIDFLYFNQVNIKFTPNSERAKIKRIQNVLSLVILILIVVQVLSVLLFLQ